MKNYTQSPLPFQGQKRRFLTPFKEALNDFSPFDDSTTVTIGAQLTHNAKYNDIMIYKNND